MGVDGPSRRVLEMLLGFVAALITGSAVRAAPRVLSLDQCADQFVMALAPRDSIVGVSHRADDQDSWLRVRAAGLPVRRASFEAVWDARPEVVVRYWGGEPKLLRALEARGVRVVTVAEAADFAGVQANVERVAEALGREAEGERVTARMADLLISARGAWREQDALYLTPGAYTSGRGTLVDAMLRAAGLRNLETRTGFRPAPLEALLLNPPGAVVRGFWDTARFSRWSLGRHGGLLRMLRPRTAADLPGATLGCPGPMAADGVRMLAEAAH